MLEVWKSFGSSWPASLAAPLPLIAYVVSPLRVVLSAALLVPLYASYYTRAHLYLQDGILYKITRAHLCNITLAHVLYLWYHILGGDEMPISEAKKKANKKWNDANQKTLYDRINVLAPKGKRDAIKAAASLHGQTTSAYIVQAVDERMKRESEGGKQSAGG